MRDIAATVKLFELAEVTDFSPDSARKNAESLRRLAYSLGEEAREESYRALSLASTFERAADFYGVTKKVEKLGGQTNVR